MNAKHLLCSLKKNPLIVQAENVCISMLPYVFCILLLFISSCAMRFDRDGTDYRHDGHDQHHDEERYEQHEEGNHQ